MWVDQLMVLQMYWPSKGWIDPCLSWLLLRSFFLVRLFFLCRGYNFFYTGPSPFIRIVSCSCVLFLLFNEMFLLPKKKRNV